MRFYTKDGISLMDNHRPISLKLYLRKKSFISYWIIFSMTFFAMLCADSENKNIKMNSSSYIWWITFILPLTMNNHLPIPMDQCKASDTFENKTIFKAFGIMGHKGNDTSDNKWPRFSQPYILACLKLWWLEYLRIYMSCFFSDVSWLCFQNCIDGSGHAAGYPL